MSITTEVVISIRPQSEVYSTQLLLKTGSYMFLLLVFVLVGSLTVLLQVSST